MNFEPKTPVRRSRNEAKTPLTPSLSSNFANLTLAPIASPGRAKRGKATTRSVFGENNTTKSFIAQGQVPIKFYKSQSLSKSTGFNLSKSLSQSTDRRSRPNSPSKPFSSHGTFVINDQLTREASGGIIKKGNKSIFDIGYDFVPAKKVEKTEMKRSRSQPAISRVCDLSVFW